MPETTTATTAVQIVPFGIQMDHPRNADIYVQSIPGCILRSTIKASRTVKDAKTGEERIPVDQTKHLGMFPEIPGMQLHVNPGKRSYSITDPLASDPALCERLGKRLAENTPFRVASKIRGVATQDGTLDAHRMKTLVREMYRLVKSGEAVCCRGTLPTEEEIEALPGEFLLNPGSRVHNGQPTFEKDWDSWVNQLTMHAG